MGFSRALVSTYLVQRYDTFALSAERRPFNMLDDATVKSIENDNNIRRPNTGIIPAPVVFAVVDPHVDCRAGIPVGTYVRYESLVGLVKRFDAEEDLFYVEVNLHLSQVVGPPVHIQKTARFVPAESNLNMISSCVIQNDEGQVLQKLDQVGQKVQINGHTCVLIGTFEKDFEIHDEVDEDNNGILNMVIPCFAGSRNTLEMVTEDAITILHAKICTYSCEDGATTDEGNEMNSISGRERFDKAFEDVSEDHDLRVYEDLLSYLQ